MFILMKWRTVVSSNTLFIFLTRRWQVPHWNLLQISPKTLTVISNLYLVRTFTIFCRIFVIIFLFGIKIIKDHRDFIMLTICGILILVNTRGPLKILNTWNDVCNHCLQHFQLWHGPPTSASRWLSCSFGHMYRRRVHMTQSLPTVIPLTLRCNMVVALDKESTTNM